MKSTALFISDIPDRPLPILDHDGLLEALWAADSLTLLMVLTHLTGDEDFLQRFAQYLYSPILGPSSVSAELGRELRDRLFARLIQLDPAPESLLSYQLFKKMANICVGEPISEEFVPSLMEQMGLVKRSRAKKIESTLQAQNFKVLVIDARLAGSLADITGRAEFKGETTQTASYYTAKVGDSVKWALGHIPYFAEWFRFRAYWIASEGLCRLDHRSRAAESGFV